MSAAAMNETRSPGVPMIALQLLLGMLCLTLLPIAWSGRPVWTLDRPTWVIVSLIGTGYVLAGLYLHWLHRGRSGRGSLLQIALIVVGALVPALLAVILWNPGFSRLATLASAPLAVVLMWVSILRWPRIGLQTAALALGAVSAIGLQIALGAGLIGQSKSKPGVSVTTIGTSLYAVEMTSYRHWIPRPQTNQGAISVFGDRYLLVTGDGDLYTFAPAANTKHLVLTRLTLRAPLNSAAFAAAIKGLPVESNWFRVADVLTKPTPRGVLVLISHHFWNADQRCYVLRVSAVEGAQADFVNRADSLHWATLFDSHPCVPLSQGDHPAAFYGIENGGRMAWLDQDHLLLSIGDHGLNGWDSAIEGITPQDPTKSYGKIVTINLADSSVENFSIGHRNPQGLIVTNTGIWSTEHGPQGGDELNLIERGHNYGWPVATFGVDYGTHAWPLSREVGSHEGFDNPFYTWIPSVGISNLIEVSGPQFPRWQGDLLIGSLVGQTLWRMRVRDERVVLTEQINFGERIRDMVQGPNGEIVVWTDSETLSFLRPARADLSSGQSMFTICAGCHVPANAQAKSIGPSLRNILERRVASLPGYDYSQALKAYGGNWTKERLDEFLQNPQAAVPGTSMHFPGMVDQASRDQLIDYLGDAGSKLDEAPAPREI